MKKTLSLLILLLTATSACAFADTPLTLQAAQHIALDTNPLSRAAYEGIVIAQEAAGIAKAPYYPEIGANAHYQRWQKHDFITLNPLPPRHPTSPAIPILKHPSKHHRPHQ